MLAVGLELWTDAIWYRSVGYDAVFWPARRQVGLFARRARRRARRCCSATSGWPAASLPPAEGAGAGGTVRGWIDRLNEAVLERSSGRGGPATRSAGGRAEAARPIDVTPLRHARTPTPIGRVVIAVVAVFVALDGRRRARRRTGRRSCSG